MADREHAHAKPGRTAQVLGVLIVLAGLSLPIVAFDLPTEVGVVVAGAGVAVFLIGAVINQGDAPTLVLGICGLILIAVVDLACVLFDSNELDSLLTCGNVLFAVSFVHGCAVLARDKGYPRILGALGLLFMLGLIIILVLPHRSRQVVAHEPVPERRTVPPPTDSMYVYFGALTEEQRAACHRIQDLLRKREGRPPQKPEIRPYVEALRAMSGAELRAIIDGESGLPNAGKEKMSG